MKLFLSAVLLVAGLATPSAPASPLCLDLLPILCPQEPAPRPSQPPANKPSKPKSPTPVGPRVPSTGIDDPPKVQKDRDRERVEVQVWLIEILWGLGQPLEGRVVQILDEPLRGRQSAVYAVPLEGAKDGVVAAAIVVSAK